MAINDIPGMPTWPEFAKSVAQSYVDCERHAREAERSGDSKEATKLRRLAAKIKRSMDKYGITIRA